MNRPADTSPASRCRRNSGLPWVKVHNRCAEADSTGPPSTRATRPVVSATSSGARSKRGRWSSFHSDVTVSGAGSPVRSVTTTGASRRTTTRCSTIAECSSSRCASSTASTSGCCRASWSSARPMVSAASPAGTSSRPANAPRGKRPGGRAAVGPDDGRSPAPGNRQRLAGEPGLAHPGRARHHDPRRTGPDRRRDPAQLLVPAGERPRPLHSVRLASGFESSADSSTALLAARRRARARVGA